MPTKRRPGLLYLQIAWPSLAIALAIQSAAVAWAGGAAQVAAWLSMLPTLSTIVLAMGAAAGGGPLVSDAIKAKAGALGHGAGPGGAP